MQIGARRAGWYRCGGVGNRPSWSSARTLDENSDSHKKEQSEYHFDIHLTRKCIPLNMMSQQHWVPPTKSTPDKSPDKSQVDKGGREGAEVDRYYSL